jgi:hypothetical protein
MSKRNKQANRAEKVLDTFSGKRGPGRPGVRASEILGRAGDYRLIFNEIWDTVGEPLLKAQKEEEVIQALDRDGRYTREFVPITSLILKVLHDPDFPKKKREAQINFLADSLAGFGWVSPRRSRDICEQERAKEKRAHYIISYEFWVTCSCGYKGRSENHACRKCGARVIFGVLFRP